MTASDALGEAYEVQAAASARGFDWPDISGVFAKVREEVAEVEEAWARGDGDHARHEVGDLLFAVVNLARFAGALPEEALRQAVDKFSRRLLLVESTLAQQDRTIEGCTLEELDAVWEAVKRLADAGVHRGLDI